MLEFYIEYLNRNIQGPRLYERGPYTIYNLQQAYNFWHDDIGRDPLRPLAADLTVFKPAQCRSEFKITITPNSKHWLEEQIKASKQPGQCSQSHPTHAYFPYSVSTVIYGGLNAIQRACRVYS